MIESREDRMLYTTQEACRLLSVGKTTLFGLLNSGELRSVRIGNARLVAHDDMIDYVAGLRRRPYEKWERHEHEETATA